MEQHLVKVRNSAAMRALGAKVASEVAGQPLGAHAKVIALTGDLGAGKTTFTQGFLKSLGVKRRIISPTFLIIRPYKLKGGRYATAYHLDCYRLRQQSELLYLGFASLLEDPTAILLIEWPEVVKKLLPRGTRWITIEHPKTGTNREVKLS